jgi:ABC-type transport system involved in cytochrome c biogenesis permease subunit
MSQTSGVVKSMRALTAVTAVLVAVSNWLIFLVVPNERVMGAVQRIFYVHVGAAFACYAAFGVVLVASVLFLANRSRGADMVGVAAGEVGFLFCTIVLITGMIWGHSAWNTWFRWEEPGWLPSWCCGLSFSPSQSCETSAIRPRPRRMEQCWGSWERPRCR